VNICACLFQKKGRAMKPDQERVRSLLIDTVTLLCKNGLSFKGSLKIQGLLGVTIDDNDIFIVQIDEKYTNDASAVLASCGEGAVVVKPLEDDKSARLVTPPFSTKRSVARVGTAGGVKKARRQIAGNARLPVCVLYNIKYILI